jgi:thiol:disulfide interchange protein DsbD
MHNQFILNCANTLRALIAVLLLLSTPNLFAEENYLPPEQAFKFSARVADAKTIEVTFAIADDYYMYRERFAFKVQGASLGMPTFPAGKIKFDETFQKNVETYRKTVTIKMPVQASGAFTLTVTSQGCADKGLCYAPMESTVKLSPNGKGGLLEAIAASQSEINGTVALDAPQAKVTASSLSMSRTEDASSVPAESEMGKIEAALKSGKLLAIASLFLLLGLGLSFTPCVLPMVPILSCIIVGEGTQVSRKRSFLLSLAYSLGMALVYTALGIAAGLAGEGLSASLQHPVILAAFAFLMVILSLAMFGVYQLQMPAVIQRKLLKVSEQQSAGKLLSVFTMGALSALIVGPCVAAPLAGALIYISQTRDVVVGGSALFAMAAGMSIPLLLIGVSAGTVLPRAGSWMGEVKRFFGVLMLGMALWIMAPILPGSAQMLGWAALTIGYGA